MEKAEFQGENNHLHHIIKECVPESELWRLLGRLNLKFCIVCALLVLFFFFFSLM